MAQHSKYQVRNANLIGILISPMELCEHSKLLLEDVIGFVAQEMALMVENAGLVLGQVMHQLLMNFGHHFQDEGFLALLILPDHARSADG